MLPAKSLKELRGLSDNELTEQHDREATLTGAGVDYYLTELNRRSQNRQTRWIVIMTGVITFATLVNVGVFIYDVIARNS